MEEKIWMEVIQQNFDTNIESRNKHTQKKKKKKTKCQLCSAGNKQQ